MSASLRMIHAIQWLSCLLATSLLGVEHVRCRNSGGFKAFVLRLPPSRVDYAASASSSHCGRLLLRGPFVTHDQRQPAVFFEPIWAVCMEILAQEGLARCAPTPGLVTGPQRARILVGQA